MKHLIRIFAVSGFLCVAVFAWTPLFAQESPTPEKKVWKNGLKMDSEAFRLAVQEAFLSSNLQFGLAQNSYNSTAFWQKSSNRLLYGPRILLTENIQNYGESKRFRSSKALIASGLLISSIPAAIIGNQLGGEDGTKAGAHTTVSLGWATLALLPSDFPETGNAINWISRISSGAFATIMALQAASSYSGSEDFKDFAYQDIGEEREAIIALGQAVWITAAARKTSTGWKKIVGMAAGISRTALALFGMITGKTDNAAPVLATYALDITWLIATGIERK